MTLCTRPRRRAAIEWFAAGCPAPVRTRRSLTLDAAAMRVYKERAGIIQAEIVWSSCSRFARRSSHQVVAFSPLEVPAFRAKSPLIIFFRKFANEYRYGQVVQRFQGLRVHHSGRRRQGSVRALLGDPGQRFQDPEGKPEGVLRCHRRSERRSGGQHQARRVTAAPAENKPGRPGFFHWVSRKEGSGAFRAAGRRCAPRKPIPRQKVSASISSASMDKRKAWRKQEELLVERWNAAAGQFRDAQAALSSRSSENGDAAPDEETVLKAKAARAELEAVRKQVARIKEIGRAHV